VAYSSAPVVSVQTDSGRTPSPEQFNQFAAKLGTSPGGSSQLTGAEMFRRFTEGYAAIALSTSGEIVGCAVLERLLTSRMALTLDLPRQFPTITEIRYSISDPEARSYDSGYRLALCRTLLAARANDIASKKIVALSGIAEIDEPGNQSGASIWISQGVSGRTLHIDIPGKFSAIITLRPHSTT